MWGAVLWCVVVLVVEAGAEDGRARAPDTSPARGPRGVLGVGDPLLEALAGARGLNRLVVCGGCRARARGPCLPVRCPAVAWRRRWALARAACVDELALPDMRVLRTARHERTCDALEHAPQMVWERTRRVACGAAPLLWRARGRYDAALLELDRPLADEEPLANSSAADHALRDIKWWMNNVEETYWSRKSEEMQRYSGATGYTYFMVGLFPTVTFFVFFLYVVFCTGTPVRVPYSNEKEGVQTPWMLHGYSSDIKCFPTYGQV